MLELLRVIRDEYRGYLEARGCQPMAEMHWVVFRFGIVDQAMRILRESAFEYIIDTRVDPEQWQKLYGVWHGHLPLAIKPKEDSFEETAKKQINNLVREPYFNLAWRGGIFGKEGQSLLCDSTPWAIENWNPIVTLASRKALWDACSPWTEGLARLFDAVQSEVSFQRALLPEEWRSADSKFSELTTFQRIAYKHLQKMRAARTRYRSFGQEGWLALARELDQAKVPLESSLDPKPKEVLTALRKKNKKVDTWEQCLAEKATVSLDDARVYKLRSHVTKSIQNAAKAAATQVEKDTKR